MGLPKFNLDALNQIEQQEEARRAAPKVANVLCVDDEPGNLSALKHLLEDEYNVFLAPSASVATEILSQNRIDVIITDQRMPEKLGTEFLTDIIDKKMANNVRIILTGFADVGVLIDCINKGLIDRYLLKPWSPDELLGTLKNAVSKITTKRTLDKLVPEKVMSKLYPGGLTEVKVGFGREFNGAVMFADIQKFTNLAETMHVIDSFKMIASFFAFIAPIVEKHGGFIDKYLGDGVMAIFDDPETGSIDCINCGIEMLKATKQYNLTHRSGNIPNFRVGQEKRRPLELGLGINVGKVVLGTVGHSDRIDITVLGDAVNTSSRIQGMTGIINTPLIVADCVIKMSKNKFKTRYLGNFNVRGKVQSLPLWEIYDQDEPQILEKKDQTLSLFNEAVSLLENEKWDEAQAKFNEVMKANPDDTVANYFAQSLAGDRTDLFLRIKGKKSTSAC